MGALRARLIRWVDALLGRMDTTPAFGWAVGFFLMALSLIPKFSHNLFGDSNVYIYLAGRMLDGERYFTDFFEYNTPFAIGVYSLPLAIGRLFGVADVLAAKLFVLLLIVSGIFMVHLVISRSREWSVPVRYNALIIALFWVLNFRNDFYSNELTTKTVVLICLLLPYIFSLQLRLEKSSLPLWLEIIIGVLLGLSSWLKPHYLLFPIVMELWLFWRLRSLRVLFRRSNIIAALIAVLGYGVLLPLYFPGYLQVLPYVPVYYSTGDLSAIDRADILLTSLLYGLPLLLWCVAMKRVLGPLGPHAVLIVMVYAALIVLNAEALLSVDQKSLFAFFVSLALLYSLLLVLRAPPALRKLEKTLAVFAILFASMGAFNLIGVVSAFRPHSFARETVSRSMVDYIHHHAESDPVFVFSDRTEHFVPALLEVGKRPYPVFHSMRMLYTIAQYKVSPLRKLDTHYWKEAEDYFYHSLLQFFEKTPPRLVFVSRINESKDWGHCWPVPLDVVHSASPQFKKIWDHHYQKIGTIIATKDPEWLEERPLHRTMLDFDNKKTEVIFPPENRTATWLDVYIWHD